MDFRIRTAKPDDLATVLALDRATELLPHWTESQYATAVTPPESGVRRCLFIAETAEKMVGFAVGMLAVIGTDLTAELESVAVAADARRMGIAKALCGSVIQWARESGAKEMELEVRSGSAGAIQLYSGLGFVAVGRRKGYYSGPTDDAVRMLLAHLDGISGQNPKEAW